MNLVFTASSKRYFINCVDQIMHGKNNILVCYGEAIEIFIDNQYRDTVTRMEIKANKIEGNLTINV